MTDVQQFLLNVIQMFDIDALGRKNGRAVIFINADNDIAAAPVIDVICESADGMNNIFRIPAFLELNPLSLDAVTAKKLLDIYR